MDPDEKERTEPKIDNAPLEKQEAAENSPAKPAYEPPKLQKFEKLEKLIISGE